VISLEQGLGLAPSDPQTIAEAASARLAELKSNPEWCAKYLEGSTAEREEMAKLTAAVAAAVPVMDTSAADTAMHEQEASAAITYLTASGGVSEAVAKQINDPNRKVSRTEFLAAKQWKNSRLADAAWRDRYLKGDVEAVRQMTLASVILSSAAEG
jgi:hypothetical protein